jgi:hypothetical protein
MFYMILRISSDYFLLILVIKMHRVFFEVSTEFLNYIFTNFWLHSVSDISYKRW